MGVPDWPSFEAVEAALGKAGTVEKGEFGWSVCYAVSSTHERYLAVVQTDVSSYSISLEPDESEGSSGCAEVGTKGVPVMGLEGLVELGEKLAAVAGRMGIPQESSGESALWRCLNSRPLSERERAAASSTAMPGDTPVAEVEHRVLNVIVRDGRVAGMTYSAEKELR